ncbi:Chromatin-associated protein swi6 [Leucoagaricus sp. SymC.cos]|nr:Chromatin-associated protein swi6 [Leucoagaricus sp. SymC.cos]
MARESPEFEDENAMNVDKDEKTTNGEGSDAGDDGEEEYEIEEIIKAKKGLFPGGKMAYFVKWKGYGAEENSWVNEDDAANAKELVDEYWRKNAKNKPQPRKSTEAKAPKRARKSTAVEEESESDSVAKKRGRKSTVRDYSDEDDESAKNKKGKKGSAKGKVQAESQRLQDMAKYMDKDDWEDLVDTVDTVERTEEDLVVYFTLKSGENIREKGDLCRKRFPQKLLRFYESNLKWRVAETEDD